MNASRLEITVLAEDRKGAPGLEGEHGLSLFLRSDREAWIFDCGQSELAAVNAGKLGISLKTARGIILSHGHYDHTGGLKAFLRAAGPLPIYAHPGIFRERFRLEEEKPPCSIGIPFPRSGLEKEGGVFDPGKSPRAISPGFSLSGEIPRLMSFERGQSYLAVKEGGRFVPDPFLDEQFLIWRDSGGLVLVTGCGHAGLINTLRRARRLFPGEKIKAVVGGFHLHCAPPETLAGIVSALEEFSPGMIIAGHCTGAAAEKLLAEKFPTEFRKLKTGSSFVL